MVLDAVSNFVRGNTDAAIASGDTTVSVVDASIFPDPATDGEFNVVIWNASNFPRPDQDGDVEIMRVTERDTTADELTVTRAQEITSASAHPDGSAIHLSPTAKMFSDIESTFDDFWDADAQQLTGDVNNTNTRTDALEAEKLNTDWLVDVGDHNNIQSAIDAAASDGKSLVIIPPGFYDETVSIPRTIHLMGASAGGTSSNRVTISGGDATTPTVTLNRQAKLTGVTVAGEAGEIGLRLSERESIVNDCSLLRNVEIQSDNNRLYSNWLNGSDINISGDGNAVFGNTLSGTITDGGAGNEVVGNT